MNQVTPWYLKTWFHILLVILILPTMGISGIIAIGLLFFKNSRITKSNVILLNENRMLKEEDLLLDIRKNIESLTTELSNLETERDIKRKEFLAELEAQRKELLIELDKLKNNRDEERKKLLSEVETEIQTLNVSKDNLLIDIGNHQNKLSGLNDTIEEKKKELIIVDENILLQEFGLYEPQYAFLKLDSFKDKLKIVRDKQKKAIKDANEVSKNTNWTVNGKASDGKKMISDVTKLLIRAFNLECDELVDRVKFNNIGTAKQRLEKTFGAINKYGKVLGIALTPEFLKLKIEELNLSYEYEVKKQQNKEEVAEQRIRLREEMIALKEIEAMKEKIIKEEVHFQQAIQKAQSQLGLATDESVKRNLEDKIKELEEKLVALEKDRQDVENREQNTRAGYVYVISNIGSFGEDVYKIGMTRRLEPFDRVNELGSASVPFKFDVHALIFSEDAPKLESTLHNYFEANSVNRINKRKEFFKVPLSEIKEVIRTNHDKEVEFEDLAYAEEFRQSTKQAL